MLVAGCFAPKQIEVAAPRRTCAAGFSVGRGHCPRRVGGLCAVAFPPRRTLQSSLGKVRHHKRRTHSLYRHRRTGARGRLAPRQRLDDHRAGEQWNYRQIGQPLPRAHIRSPGLRLQRSASLGFMDTCRASRSRLYGAATPWRRPRNRARTLLGHSGCHRNGPPAPGTGAGPLARGRLLLSGLAQGCGAALDDRRSDYWRYPALHALSIGCQGTGALGHP